MLLQVRAEVVTSKQMSVACKGESSEILILLLFGVAHETGAQLAAEEIDQHLNSARLDGLVSNAGIDCFMAFP